MATDANDLGEMIGATLGRIVHEAASNGLGNGNGHGLSLRNGSGSLSGIRGVAAGAALAAAAPLAAKGASKVAGSAAAKRLGSAAGSAADAPKAAKKAGEKLLPGGGGDAEGSKGGKGTPGVGKGRRMPVQQAVDVAVPLQTAYNQWTQFEEWPEFMHRLVQVTQEEDEKVSFKAKAWGMSKEFVAEIVEQRPDERIQWEVSQGMVHRGVVTFHELGPRLTRVQVSIDFEPGSLIEKMARGMRHTKRAVRADMARFKAFVEMQEEETGGWRGEIRDGKVVKKRSGGSSSGKRSGSSSSRHGGRSRGSGSSRKRSSRS